MGPVGAGHPWEALRELKQSSWSPWRLGLPFLGTHRKSKSPKFLAAPDPGKFEGRKKKRNVSGSEVRRAYWLVGLDLGEPEHRAGMDGAQAPGGAGWLSGLLIGAGSKQGQTAQMPTRGGYSCRVKV